jgi:hypothetical protein
MFTDSKSEDRDRRAIDYLLGKLSDQEKIDFEEAYFADPDLFEHVCAVEQDLIEDYLHEKLSKEDRELFDQHYRNTARWEENAPFSKVLLRAIESEEVEREVDAAKEAIVEPRPTNKASLIGSRRFFMAAALVVITVLMAISSWLIFKTQMLERRLGAEEQKSAALENTEHDRSSQLERQRYHCESLFKEIQMIHVQFKSMVQDNKHSESFLVSPQSTRGSEPPQEITIHSGVRWVQLRLEIVGQQFKNYKAVVRPVGGEPVWLDLISSQIISSAPPTCAVELPTDRLKTGTYVVTLEGFADYSEIKYVGQYLFVIVRK